MLDNYKIDESTGVLTQVDRKPFMYDDEYIAKGYANVPIANFIRLSNIRYSVIERYCSTMGRKRILDVGYGDGAFLNFCVGAGYICTGFDVKQPHRSNQFPVVSSISEGEYDVITFFDALEHVEDINDTIESLAPHKYLVITVPCLREDWNSIFFAKWKHRKPNEHLWHFTPNTLQAFIEGHGYKMLYMGNPEDEVRTGVDKGYWNTMTAIFEKV